MEMVFDGSSLVRMASRYEGAAPIVADETKTSMLRSVIAIEGTAKRNVAPFSDTDTLQRSLTHEVQATGGMVVGRAGTNVKYGKVVEDGRAAGATMPPPAALVQGGWLRRHGIPDSAAFVVARAIGRRGIKARPYLKPALQSNLVFIQREFDSLMTRVMKRLAAP
jgi:hypothetical protein